MTPRSGSSAHCLTSATPLDAGTTRVRVMSDQLDAAAEALGTAGSTSAEVGLDVAVRRMRLVEALLDDMAAAPSVAPGLVSRVLAVRDDLRVHVFAASTLRSLNLAANAGGVLRRGVDSARARLAALSLDT